MCATTSCKPSIMYTNIVGGFVAAQELRDFKTNTILEYMVLNGKGSNRLCSSWVQSCCLSFLTGQSNMAVC